jgi:hypothetical protein
MFSSLSVVDADGKPDSPSSVTHVRPYFNLSVWLYTLHSDKALSLHCADSLQWISKTLNLQVYKNPITAHCSTLVRVAKGASILMSLVVKDNINGECQISHNNNNEITRLSLRVHSAVDPIAKEYFRGSKEAGEWIWVLPPSNVDINTAWNYAYLHSCIHFHDNVLN